MGDEDNEEIADWMDEYDTHWSHSQSPTYSDVETWIIEKSVEAKTDGRISDRINAKRELYLLKCKLDRIYESLPKHPKQELEWDKQEVVRILKTSSK